jgi:hypothetical protein
MKILVGSSAAKVHLPFLREAKDIDAWCREKILGVDYSVMPPEIFRLMEHDSLVNRCASLNDLLTIKLSHLPYDIFWHKHLNDYLVFKKHGATVNKKLYEYLQEYWKEVHGNKTNLSLYKTKDVFFDDFVKKEYDHDYLHELVAFPHNPVYSVCLKDGQDVMIDKEKFFSLPFEQQVKMFREEVNVIACERWLIPTRDTSKITFREAYSKSLHKTVTALTKGWASRFMCENIELFLKPNRKEVEHLFCVVGINV